MVVGCCGDHPGGNFLAISTSITEVSALVMLETDACIGSFTLSSKGRTLVAISSRFAMHLGDLGLRKKSLVGKCIL